MIPEFLRPGNIEIVADEGKPYLLKVDFIPFKEWPATVKYSYAVKLESDKKAYMAIEQILGITDKDEQIEKYAYCVNGGFDNKADIVSNGTHTPEYFDCPFRAQCPEKAQKHLCGTFKAPNGYLHPAEIKVIKLIAQDMADKEIAHKLDISYNTATKHRANIIKKLGVNSKQGITAFAFEKGII